MQKATEETPPQLVRAGNPTVRKIFPVSKARIYQLANSGELPHYRVGKVILLDLHELEQWVRAHRRGGR